jgi:hypothetical protein
MRELTTFEQRVLMQLENLEKENANLHNITKEAAFKIKSLEEKVEDMLLAMAALHTLSHNRI